MPCLCFLRSFVHPLDPISFGRNKYFEPGTFPEHAGFPDCHAGKGNNLISKEKPAPVTVVPSDKKCFLFCVRYTGSVILNDDPAPVSKDLVGGNNLRCADAWL